MYIVVTLKITFPDKAIDIFDLSCVKARFNQQHIITKQIVKDVIEEYTLIKINDNYDFDKIKSKLQFGNNWSK